MCVNQRRQAKTRKRVRVGHSSGPSPVTSGDGGGMLEETARRTCQAKIIRQESNLFSQTILAEVVSTFFSSLASLVYPAMRNILHIVLALLPFSAFSMPIAVNVEYDGFGGFHLRCSVNYEPQVCFFTLF